MPSLRVSGDPPRVGPPRRALATSSCSMTASSMGAGGVFGRLGGGPVAAGLQSEQLPFGAALGPQQSDRQPARTFGSAAGAGQPPAAAAPAAFGQSSAGSPAGFGGGFGAAAPQPAASPFGSATGAVGVHSFWESPIRESSVPVPANWHRSQLHRSLNAVDPSPAFFRASRFPAKCNLIQELATMLRVHACAQ